MGDLDLLVAEWIKLFNVVMGIRLTFEIFLVLTQFANFERLFAKIAHFN